MQIKLGDLILIREKIILVSESSKELDVCWEEHWNKAIVTGFPDDKNITIFSTTGKICCVNIFWVKRVLSNLGE